MGRVRSDAEKQKKILEVHEKIYKEQHESKSNVVDEITPSSNHNLQHALDRVKDRPLVGVEYILEILHEDRRSSYRCTLCDLRCEPIPHLSSHRHIMMYVQMHFKSAHRHFETNKVKQIKEEHKLVLEKLAWAIEKTFGRLKHHQLTSREFKGNEEARKKAVRRGPHFNESHGQTFEDLAVKELAKVKDLGLSKMADNEVSSTTLIEREQGKNPSCFNLYNDEDFDGVPLSTPKNKEYEKKLMVYHELVKGIEEDMNEVLLKHRQNPDGHPQYNEEWKKFWKTRHRELLSEGKDPSTYNYEAEWKGVWAERMLELHNEETESKKREVKKKLGLLDEPISITNSKREVVLLGDYYDYSRHGTRERSGLLSSMIADSPHDSSNSRIPPTSNKTPLLKLEDFFYCRKDASPKYSPPPSENFPSSSGKRSPLLKIPPSSSADSQSRGKRSPLLKTIPSPLRNSPSCSTESPDLHRYSPCLRTDSPSPSRNLSTRRGYSPFIYEDSPVLNRDSLSNSRNSPSRLRVSPSRGRFSRSRSRDSPTRRRYSPSHRRDSPSHRRDSPSHPRDSPSRSRNSSSRLRVSPFRHKDSTSRSQISPSRRRDSPTRRRYSPLRGESSNVRSERRSRSIEKSSDITRKRKRDSYNEYKNTSDDPDIKLTAVLRQLIVLADKLGSLWTKVIDLSVNARTMENKKSNSSEELLDIESNWILFESVRAKLTDQLKSGLLDDAQEKIIENAVKKVDSIIGRAKERRLRKGQESLENVLVVPGVGVVDKKEISMQIVDKLLAQGKRDITQEELDEMIRVLAKKDVPQPGYRLTNTESHQQEKRKIKFALKRTKNCVNNEGFTLSSHQNKLLHIGGTSSQQTTNQQPLLHYQQPLLHHQQPLLHHQQPLLHHQQPLLHYQQLTRGGPVSYQPIRGGNVDFREGLSSHRMEQIVDMGGLVNCNSGHRGIPTSFPGNILIRRPMINQRSRENLVNININQQFM